MVNIRKVWITPRTGWPSRKWWRLVHARCLRSSHHDRNKSVSSRSICWCSSSRLRSGYPKTIKSSTQLVTSDARRSILLSLLSNLSLIFSNFWSIQSFKSSKWSWNCSSNGLYSCGVGSLNLKSNGEGGGVLIPSLLSRCLLMLFWRPRRLFTICLQANESNFPLSLVKWSSGKVGTSANHTK